jgi:enediyne biosynthesis protein E3
MPIASLLFHLSDQEATFRRRRFPVCEPAAQAHLEAIGRSFLTGYNASLSGRPPALRAKLESVPAALRGFAYEGAAMGCAILDFLTPWSRGRFAQLLAAAPEHIYMLHVGFGWAMARLRRLPWRTGRELDSLLRWLAVDGYGFHQGYFRWERYIRDAVPPAELSGYARRAFDQGLGRSLWFVCGASAGRIAAAVARFDPERQADLWSGAGLACAYAGEAPVDEIRALADLAGPHRPAAAQGAAFAAKARLRAGNPAAHTGEACQVLCGLDLQRAAAITDEAARDLPDTGSGPAYEIWRRRIQSQFGG